jgi:hypothetical protein
MNADAPKSIFNRDLLAVNDAVGVIASGIKPVSGVPATVVRQEVMATIHHHDGIGSQPPIARMRSDAEVHVAAVAESAMQRETFMRVAAVAENGRAVRHASLFIDTCTKSHDLTKL